MDKAVSSLSLASLQTFPDSEELRRGGGVVVAAAEVPTSAFRPRKAVNLALAIVVGLALGVALAFLAENLDDRLRGPEEVEHRVGAPVLGYIPHVPEWETAGSVAIAALNDPTSGAAEAYRTLRANLRFISLQRPLRTLAITSLMPARAPSTTAANLATTFALGGTRTILVSGDLRKPTIHNFFGLPDVRVSPGPSKISARKLFVEDGRDAGR
jgi:hypothetical protein